MRDSGKALAAIKPLLWADTFGPDVEPNKVGRKTIFYRLALGLLTLALVLNISCRGGGETAQVPAASKAPVISTPTAAAILAQTATAVVSPPAVVTRTADPRPTFVPTANTTAAATGTPAPRPTDTPGLRPTATPVVPPISTPSPIPAVQLPTSPKPNVLLITVDSLRADHLASYGNPRVKTPNLDALAQGGVRFSLDIAQFPQTDPSHASIFTSTYPVTHRVTQGGGKLAEPLSTLASMLTSSGYTTAGIYSFPSLDPESGGLDRGFMTYEGVYVPVPGEADPWRQWDGRANVTTDGALEYLKLNTSMPFFLWVHYQDPHYPYAPPPPFDTMYDQCQTCADCSFDTVDRIGAGENFSPADIAHITALYDGEISFTDQEIGRLLAGMRNANLLNNTLVIATADHGESLSDNGLWFHPTVLYNSVIRVPLLVNYPGIAPAGAVVDVAVQNLDIMPTILAAAGISSLAQAEGNSLWPLMLGRETGEGRVAFAEGLEDNSIAVVTRDWKLIRNNAKGTLELYDLKSDFGELNNLASANPGQALAMENKVKAWMTRHSIGP